MEQNQTERLNVEEKIKRSFILLFKNDEYLLHTEVNERALTHQFAVYLADEFLGYSVDCEYNRNGIDKKKLRSFRKEIYSDDTEGATVYPDIIVHHRGTKSNFIVIEAKKTSNKNQEDIRKLEAYKKELGYKYAVFVQFPVGKGLGGFTEENISECIAFI
ncbi:MAG: hypothetical protein WC374_07645 [Phycisphaerae bacterium]|jgi:hypothetical protein